MVVAWWWRGNGSDVATYLEQGSIISLVLVLVFVDDEGVLRRVELVDPLTTTTTTTKHQGELGCAGGGGGGGGGGSLRLLPLNDSDHSSVERVRAILAAHHAPDLAGRRRDGCWVYGVYGGKYECVWGI